LVVHRSRHIGLTAREPPRFRLYFSFPRQAGRLFGGCSPRHCPLWVFSGLGAWWTALLVLAILGISTALRTRSAASAVPAASAAVPAACAVTLQVGYGLFDPYAWPRYMLPVIALMAIPVADGIARLVAARRGRAAALPLVAAFLLAGLVTQHYVLRVQAASLLHNKPGTACMSQACESVSTSGNERSRPGLT
jgi:hypothetical protein